MLSKYRLVIEIANFVLLKELQIIPYKKILIIQFFNFVCN